MSPSRARFVTVCQQLLALGVVVVALVPATQVVSLDVVGVHPGAEQPGLRIAPRGDVPAYERARRSVQIVEQHAPRHALGGRDGVQAVRTGR